MVFENRTINVVMGGGGVKGIAYIGVFAIMERMGYTLANLAGVSAGSLAGAFAAAGYNSSGMWDIMQKFDFEKVQMDRIPQKVPVVGHLMGYAKKTDIRSDNLATEFLSKRNIWFDPTGFADERAGVFGNIITFCKEGCLFDGDLLEEWVRNSLAAKGVRTFADLRGGRQDKMNPNGYKVRMTGVDCNRGKVVVLPDDVSFYGINPDDFEVAKAVRISTCVPFAFKPVEIKAAINGKTRIFNLVDGGVLDSFPDWVIENTGERTVGFKLNGGESKFFSLDTPLSILKTLVSAVTNIGVPKEKAPDFEVEEINTTKVNFLDFNLTEEDKKYMYAAGESAAISLFSRFEPKKARDWKYLRYPFFRRH